MLPSKILLLLQKQEVQFICNHVLNNSLALQTITLTRVHLCVQRSWIKLRLFGTVGGTNLSMFLARHLLPSLSIGSLPSAMFSGVGQGRSRQSAHGDTSRPRLTQESQHRHTWSCMLVAPHCHKYKIVSNYLIRVFLLRMLLF